VYVHVLASSLLLTILGLGSLGAVRLELRSARLLHDGAAARTCAVSALELGLRQTCQNPNWRTAWPNGTWLSDKELGAGRLTLQGVDPTDGVLADSVRDPLVLTGIGTCGLARHQVQVIMVPVIESLEALNACLCASGQIKTNGGKRLTALGAPVCTNGQLDNDGVIDGNAEGQSIDHTGTVTGVCTIPGTIRPMPAATVLTDYAGKATSIPYAATIEKVVLTPGCNPLGPTDPNGLYLIDAASGNLTLRKSRIHGTLIIRGPGRTITIENAVFLQNYRADFPALLVEGNLVIKCDSATTPLSEPACATNFNPVGAPYEGATDTDQADSYPNEIRGLVHVKGSLKLQQTARFVGAVICEGNVSCEEANTIVHDAGLYTSPPAGYTCVDGMKVSPGSWKQVVD
jgi:hypothetical protein